MKNSIRGILALGLLVSLGASGGESPGYSLETELKEGWHLEALTLVKGQKQKRITVFEVDRITLGMTSKDAMRILGLPYEMQRTQTNDPTYCPSELMLWTYKYGPGYLYIWMCDGKVKGAGSVQKTSKVES